MSLITYLRLLLAGWRPNRNVWDSLEKPASLDVFPAAKRVLSEFGNLEFGNSSYRVSLRPNVPDDVLAQFKHCKKLGSGHSVYPLGTIKHQDRRYLLIDIMGVVYTLIEEPEEIGTSFELEPLATTFEQALSYFLNMKAANVEREKDLDSADLLEKTWRFPAVKHD